MMKFACFERTVEAIYAYVVPKPRDQCSKSEQLVVTFAAGYIAGVFCAIVSHPADTLVSYMNKVQGATLGSGVKDLGFKGLWGGLGPRIIMIGTLTALQWFIYDAVKVGNYYCHIHANMQSSFDAMRVVDAIVFRCNCVCRDHCPHRCPRASRRSWAWPKNRKT